jgi:hypothetical protein
MLLLFCVVAAAALGFVVGRVWEMRQTINNRDRINAFALRAKLPTVYGEKPYSADNDL